MSRFGCVVPVALLAPVAPVRASLNWLETTSGLTKVCAVSFNVEFVKSITSLDATEWADLDDQMWSALTHWIETARSRLKLALKHEE